MVSDTAKTLSHNNLSHKYKVTLEIQQREPIIFEVFRITVE